MESSEGAVNLASGMNLWVTFTRITWCWLAKVPAWGAGTMRLCRCVGAVQRFRRGVGAHTCRGGVCGRNAHFFAVCRSVGFGGFVGFGAVCARRGSAWRGGRGRVEVIGCFAVPSHYSEARNSGKAKSVSKVFQCQVRRVSLVVRHGGLPQI